MPSFRRLISDLRRQIDQFDLVGVLKHAVGHGFPHLHVRDALDDVVKAFQVLDVHRRKHVDAGFKDLFDVLVAFDVPASWNVGVSQFVHQHQLGPAPEDGVEVHLGEEPAAVVDLPAGQRLQSVEQRFGVAPSVGLDHPDHDIDLLPPLVAGGFQHGEGLADAGGGAEKDLQPAAPLPVGLGQERFRGRAVVAVGVGHQFIRAGGMP